MKFTTLIAALIAPIIAMAAVSSVETKVAAPDEIQINSHGLINLFADKKGQLYVKLNHATNLRNKDTFGKSDPFVEKDYKQRSKDTKGQSPVFDQTFCFYVRPGQSKLYVRAVDKDTFSNDKIRDTSISLDQAMASGNAGPQDYDLPKWMGLRSDGKLNLQMQFVEDKSP